MQIKPLSNNVYLSKNNRENVKSNEELKESPIQDRLELSQEAKEIQKSQSQNSTKNLDKIKEKMNSNFYDSNSVINNIADKILKEIKQK